MDNNPIGGQPIQDISPEPAQPLAQPNQQIVPTQQPQFITPQPLQDNYFQPNPNQTPVIASPNPVVPVMAMTNPIPADINNPIATNNISNITKKSNPKIIKIIVIALIAIALIIGGYFTVKLFFSNTNNNTEAKLLDKFFDPKKPIIIEKDEKFGFISSDGAMMVEPKYSAIITNFIGDYALVKKETDSDSDYVYQLIDKKGTVIKDSKKDGNIDSLVDNEVWVIGDSLYDKNLKQISPKDIKVSTLYVSDKANVLSFESKDNKSEGLINTSGKIIYKYVFKEGEYTFSVPDFIMDDDEVLETFYGEVELHDKTAIVNFKTGKVVYDFTEKKISTVGQNVFFVCKDSVSAYSPQENCDSSFYIENDKIVYKVDAPLYIYEVLNSDTDNKVIEISIPNGSDIDSKYYDVKSKKLLDTLPDYNDPKKRSEYKCDEKYGIMKDNKVAVKCNYDEIEYLSEKTYQYVKQKVNKEIVILKNKSADYDYYSRNNTYDYELFDFVSNKPIKNFSKLVNLGTDRDSVFIVSVLSDKHTFYNLISDKSIDISGSEFQSELYSNYFTVTKDTKTAYYNTDLKKIYETKN